MKRLLRNQVIKVIIAVIIVTLVLGGLVYAYQTVWSGKAQISITGPAPIPELEITGWSTDADGEWNSSTNIWIAHIGPGDSTHLILSLENTGNSPISYKPYADGQEINTIVNYAPYIFIQTTGDKSLDAYESGSITFRVTAYPSAPPGDVPEIDLELRQY